MTENKIGKIIRNIGTYLLHNKYLIFLIIVAVVARATYPLTGSFALIFDHGKDGLNALDMLHGGHIKLVGPWTSIPGLYFGAAWYYFLAVCLYVGKLSPAAPVWGMIVLAVVQIILAYRYFGRTAATVVAASATWLTIAVSAWNPYPLPLVSWLVLILLQKTSQDRRLTAWRAFGFGFLAALGFHFSSAYAVFYPIIILLCWWIQRLIIDKKAILWAIIGFVVPSIPQMIFEFRHQFGELRAVWQYLSAGGEVGDGLSVGKVVEVVTTTLGEWRLAAFPELIWPGERESGKLGLIFVGMWLALLGWYLWRVVRKKADLPPLFWECVVMAVLPVAGFCLLHFNLWYLLGALPAVTLLVCWVVEQYRWSQVVWCTAMLVSLASVIYREYRTNDINRVDVFYRQIAQAWETVKQESHGQPFSLYVYRPDIYDFNYQYVIITDALVNGTPLPVEFAYKPYAPTYIDFKERLIADLPRQQGREEHVFYLLDGRDLESPTYRAWVDANPGFKNAKWLSTVGENLQIWRADFQYPVSVKGQ